MYCCDKCGKTLLIEYYSLTSVGHKYMKENLYSSNYIWVDGEPSRGIHLCEECVNELNGWFDYRRRTVDDIEES